VLPELNSMVLNGLSGISRIICRYSSLPSAINSKPEHESVATTLSLLKGWLVDQWTPEQAKGAVSKHPGAQPVKDPPPRSAERQEYWFSEDRAWGLWSRRTDGVCTPEGNACRHGE